MDGGPSEWRRRPTNGLVYIDPPSTLRLEGALAPIQAMGALGHLTFTLKPSGGKTDITAFYDVGGHEAGGMTALATGVGGVLGEQLASLKTAVEAGNAP